MKLLIFALISSLLTLAAQAGLLDVKLKLDRRTYMSYQHVYATVTVTNNTGRNLRLHNANGQNWLDFNIMKNGTQRVGLNGRLVFPDMQIPAGAQLKRRFALTQIYSLVSQGNYIVRARVSQPGQDSIGINQSNMQAFDIFDGAPVFQRQQGIAAKGGKVIEYRVKSLNQSTGAELFFQSYDPKVKEVLVTYTLGKYVTLSRPEFKIDGEGMLNLLFRVNHKVFRYMKIAPSGKVLSQKFHQRLPNGNPSLLTHQGKVYVRNAVAYNQKKEIEKARAIHNISQRPPFAY